MKTLTNKFDINVWNRGAYLETGHDEWVLCPVTILEDFSGYGYGKEMPELNLVLTSKEAEQLTLGWGPDLGGAWYADDDFWIDSDAFKKVYDVPEMVGVWIDFVSNIL